MIPELFIVNNEEVRSVAQAKPSRGAKLFWSAVALAIHRGISRALINATPIP